MSGRRETPAVIRLLPHEEAEMESLLSLDIVLLRERYLKVAKRQPIDNKPPQTLLSRRTMAELIIWYERPMSIRSPSRRDLHGRFSSDEIPGPSARGGSLRSP